MQNKKYQVEITRASDGKIVIQDMEFPDDEVVVSLFWMGNYSCDCNRAIFFGDRKVEDDIPCSEGKYYVRVTRDGEKVYEDDKEDAPKVYENHGQDSRIKEVDIVPQLNAKAGTGGGNLPLVQEPVTCDMMQVTAPINRQNREPGDPCHTLAKGNAGNAAVVHSFTQNQSGDILIGAVSPSMGTNCNASGRNTPKINNGATVRRLTPTECERLQGFPDGYTKIPYRNKPADQCPDGPRYKALGNSWAVPCAAWLCKRIQEVDHKRTI